MADPPALVLARIEFNVEPELSSPTATFVFCWPML